MLDRVAGFVFFFVDRVYNKIYGYKLMFNIIGSL